MQEKIQIIYPGGMFGNLLRFLLDRSLPDSKLKTITNPFTEQNNLQSNDETDDDDCNDQCHLNTVQDCYDERNQTVDNGERGGIEAFDDAVEIDHEILEFFGDTFHLLHESRV